MPRSPASPAGIAAPSDASSAATSPEKLSPEQISGFLGRLGLLDICHESIYIHIWRDKHRGG